MIVTRSACQAGRFLRVTYFEKITYSVIPEKSGIQASLTINFIKRIYNE